MPGPSPKIDDELIARVVSAMRVGAGYLRATQMQGMSRSTAAGWKRRGKADLQRGNDSPYAKFARAVLEQEAKLIAKAEHTVHKAVHDGDVHSAKWVLTKLLPEEYGDRVDIRVTQQLESLLDQIEGMVSHSAWMEVVNAIARIQGLDPEASGEEEAGAFH